MDGRRASRPPWRAPLWESVFYVGCPSQTVRPQHALVEPQEAPVRATVRTQTRVLHLRGEGGRCAWLREGAARVEGTRFSSRLCLPLQHLQQPGRCARSTGGSVARAVYEPLGVDGHLSVGLVVTRCLSSSVVSLSRRERAGHIVSIGLRCVRGCSMEVSLCNRGGRQERGRRPPTHLPWNS